MRFHFQLRLMSDIAPWRDADGASPHLSWFGLTDGWYWIEAGATELFRYHHTLVDKWKREHSGASWLGALPYVDYQVSRLWEDVLDLLPEALDPVPPRLAHALSPDGPWVIWERAALAAVEHALPEQESWELLEAAAGWWWVRRLDTAYLQSGPSIWFWSDGANVHVQWDNREHVLDDHPAWEANAGQHALPAPAFLAEVRDFNERLMSRMRDRVAMAQAEWARPDVALDPHLAEEQLVRAGRLARRLETAASREPTNWDAVYRAIAAIEALPTFAFDHSAQLP